MKLTIVLLIAAVLNVNAKGVAQTVTFSGNNIPIEKAFTAIKQQTGYYCFYNEVMLKGIQPISIEAVNLPLKEFMSKLLDGQPLEYSIENKSIVINRKLPAPTKDFKSAASILAPLNDVRGRVTNENGEPLVGANIKVMGSDLGASTDDNGYYKIENISAGEYTLIASFVGYATKKVTVKVTENSVAAFNFTLVPSLVNLDEMTVTSTLSKRAIRAYPATIAVIKQEDLKNRNINNIANVLDAVPGIIVTPGYEGLNNGQVRLPQGVLIRGSSSNFASPIKYMIDGIEVITISSAVNILQMLDPNDIEKIEILKGPMASTLYGSGAASGVISITTKKGKVGKTQVNFKTMFTNYANDYANYNGYNQNYSLNVSGGSDQFNYLFGAGYNFYPLTKLTDVNNGIDTKTWSYTAKIGGKIKNISADVSLQYGTEKSGSGSTDSSYNKFRESIGLSTYPVNPLQDNKYSQRGFLTTLHLTHNITNNWYHDLTIGYNITNYVDFNYSRSDYDSTFYNYEFLDSKMNARYFMFYDHSWSSKLKTSITAGLEYNSYESHVMYLTSYNPLVNFFTTSSPAIDGAASYSKSPYSSTGYFAEAVTSFKNNLFLTTGIRYDVNSAYGESVGAYPQPRVGLSYVIEQGKFKIKPRVVWGVSSEAPNPTYKKDAIIPGTYGTTVVTGNPDIKPQRSEGYEFGADIFYGSNYSLNITYYDQKIKDMIRNLSSYDFSTSPPTFNYYFYNIGKVINKGLEVSAKALLEPFVVDLSYTQTSSKWGNEISQTQSPLDYPHAPFSGIPKNSIFARLSYKIPSFLSWTKKGGNISLDYRYNGSAFNLNDINYSLAIDAWNNAPDPKPAYPSYYNYVIWQKGYSFFNLRADYSLSNYAMLYIDVQNLLDKQGSTNGQSASLFPGRRINFGCNITL